MRMGNVDSASRLIARLRAEGAREFCVCAGSRNSPLLAVLGVAGLSGVPVYSFVDERSASFFALGRSKLHGQPVAVVTTSGTAVAEMLPAAIEAFYSGVPLILVSADRPARFRRTGAPQSIEQTGIFGVYAETDLGRWSRRGPLHVNVEFDEPLIDGPIPTASAPPSDEARPAARPAGDPPDLERVLGARPLVIVGGLGSAHRERVAGFVRALGAPMYAAPLSGLREEGNLPRITSGERMVRLGGFDSVVRIGNVPTLRFWRDLEDLELPVVHFSDLPFPGLTRGEIHPMASLPASPPSRQRSDGFVDRDREIARSFDRLLREEPESELAMIRALSEEVADRARVYVGNSLPIREWDLAASRAPRGLTVEASRGANGIDGQLSTFFGQCDPARENLCVVGDLTAICDLGAPWIVRQLPDLRFRIAIVNNRGGRIFGRVPSLRELDRGVRERLIENGHDLRFGPWAEMWGIADRVTELLPDADASARVWKRFEELWE